MDTAQSLREEVADLRIKLQRAEHRLMMATGRVILLCSDPRYKKIHDDTRSNVVAEGTIVISPEGSPHTLSFIYDDLIPTHCMSLEVVEGDQVLSDGEEDDDDNPFPNAKMESIPITSDRVQYGFDLPPNLTIGGMYRFFVIAPSSS